MSENKAEEGGLDIGSVLRQRRMQRGQSIESVHQQTRIPKKLLEALEANRHDAFPAPVYLRGFLKSYCEYLEIDFESFWRQMAPSEKTGQQNVESGANNVSAPARTPFGAPAPVESHAPARPPVGKSGSPEPASGGHDRQPHGKPAPKQAAQPAQTRDAALIPGMVLAGLAAIGGLMWAFQDKEPLPEPRREATLPAAIKPIAPTNDPALRITARRDLHVRLKVDGLLRFEGRLPARTPQEWMAKRGFSLRASDPADLDILFDGKQVPLESFPEDADGFHIIAR